MTMNMLHTNASQETAPMNAIYAMLEKSRRYDLDKQDYTGSTRSYRMDDRGMVQFSQALPMFGANAVSVTEPIDLTDNATRQLLGRLSPTMFGSGSNKLINADTFDAMRRRFTGEYASIMNALLQTATGNLMMRTYRNEGRAFLSSRYAIFDNTAALEGVVKVLEPEASQVDGLRVCGRSAVTPDELHLYVEFKEDDGTDLEGRTGNYSIGFYIGNGETGGRSLSIAPFIKRRSCDNSIIVNLEQQFKFRHTGDPMILASQFKVTILNMLPLADKAVQRIYEAELESLPSFAETLRGLKKEYNWSDKVYDAVLVGTERQETRMGIVNGISYAAHAAVENLGVRADMEAQAGAILVAPDSLFARAARQGAEHETVRRSSRR